MSDTVVVDGACELEIPIEGECGTFYKVNPTSEALTVQPTSEDVTYQPTADYFSEVTVEGIKGERTITRNGDYDVLADKQVTVAVDPPVLDSLTVTANGTYTRQGGYNPVTVAIPEYEGAYTVEPSTEEQTLATAGKVMGQDVVINKAESGIRIYSSKKVEADASYSTFDDFQRAMLPDLPMDRDFVMIDFENNTSNNRAGIGWVRAKVPKTNMFATYGRRVGDQFGGSYGCNVYAGATINVYVGDY